MIPNLPNQSYIRLIEEQAHYYLPIKQVKFKDYVNAEDLCRLYDTPPDELFNFVQSSDAIHGVMCESGGVLRSSFRAYQASSQVGSARDEDWEGV